MFFILVKRFCCWLQGLNCAPGVCGSRLAVWFRATWATRSWEDGDPAGFSVPPATYLGGASRTWVGFICYLISRTQLSCCFPHVMSWKTGMCDGKMKIKFFRNLFTVMIMFRVTVKSQVFSFCFLENELFDWETCFLDSLTEIKSFCVILANQ